MGICGVYARSFSEANIASVADISMNADYPHFFFDVVEVGMGKVTLRSHSNGEEMELNIKNKGSSEFAEISMRSSFEKMFKQKPHKFKIYPMEGKRT